MMRTFLTVLRKEIVDNLRDRRSLVTALIMGPIFGPVLFAFVMNFSIERFLDDAETVMELPVIGQAHAPNLLRFLASHNIDIVAGPEGSAAEAVKAGRHDFVLVIPERFGDQLRDTIPARIELYSDTANSEGRKEVRRVQSALASYNRQLATLRLSSRGVNPSIFRAINVDEIDVSTPGGRSAMLLGMMSYFTIFALLMGGMSLAIDTTAGERERGSLEPLLALPVTRTQLILGKIAAACVFMLFSLLLCLLSFYALLSFMPLEQLGMTPNFGLNVVAAAFLLLAPFVLVGASLMTLVASFTKSYKEAQTWLSIVLLTPTLPILIVSILALRPQLEFMFVPSLSQHLLLVDMIKNEPLNSGHVAISVLSTLAVGALLTWVCARLYRREGLLV